VGYYGWYSQNCFFPSQFYPGNEKWLDQLCYYCGPLKDYFILSSIFYWCQVAGRLKPRSQDQELSALPSMLPMSALAKLFFYFSIFFLAQALLGNIRQGWNRLTMTQPQNLITVIKSFILQGLLSQVMVSKISCQSNQ
jgi:hypothetical protein